MSNHYRILREKINLLKLIYPEIALYEVSSADIYYTDGLAVDAKFKISFLSDGKYVSTVYIKTDGTWFSTVDSPPVKKAMTDWIQEVNLMSQSQLPLEPVNLQ
jgi:hypothetical protein